MLSRIDLQHFKCFEMLKLPLCPLTLLTGANSSGKTSVLQALVLLHQTMRGHEWSSRLMLNGETLGLGTVADVIDEVYGHSVCRMTLFDGESDQYEWAFEGEGRNAKSLAVQRVRGEAASVGTWDSDGSHGLHHLLPVDAHDDLLADRLCQLNYLTAERLGPREYYPFHDSQLSPVVGPRGEYAVSVLYSGRNAPVLTGLVKAESPPRRLSQVEQYMEDFFPGCVLHIEQVAHVDLLSLEIRTLTASSFHRPVHTGFGITQVLPIVVAAISATRDDLLLIENPEVHLHPSGQAAMGRFLGLVASSGVQVLVETHSDHVLNGIRCAVKSGMLPSESVAIHFFRPRSTGEDSNRVPQVQSPAIDSDGDLDSWPAGFFDQFDIDMNYLAGWS